ncbi:protein BLISTER-like isoform X1 [Camellia sinensis]|uniref:protein BLISTER-like isoform X1 n=1 Tax=Camellia sinensis TaxID=4442 RepID=UPI0010369DE3|nr:protein BLISTER-like isoform X1 [Camellia sinensis]XP_028054412.1 protein BLISTER-like isoform X1 [Camellia sinensis]
MASAQVLPSTASTAKKQEHLEAGKRRLEEFRKKKAADRAKKSAPAINANVVRHDEQPLDNQRVRLTDSNGVGTSDGVSEKVEPSRVVFDDENKANEFVQKNELGSSDTNAKPPVPTNYYNAFSAATVQAHMKDQEFDRYNALHSTGTVNVNYGHQPQEKNDDLSISTGASIRHGDGIATDQSVAFRPQVVWETDGNSGQPGPYGLEGAHSKDNDHVKDFTVTSSATHDIVANVSRENSGSFLLQNKFGYTSPQASGLMSLYGDSVHPSTKIRESYVEVGQNRHAVPESNNTMTFDVEERKLSNSAGHLPGGNSTPFWPSESRSTAFSFDLRSSSDNLPLYPDIAETNTRRSRPSFLDSLNMPSATSASEKPFTETETTQTFSKWKSSNVPSAFEHSRTSAISSGHGDDMFRHTVNDNSMERKRDSYSRKQDEDFAALEQHIEDLTQEKFSMQRALEASRALAESLATENSSLTDSYNQQGSVVSQLKSDMETLQEEIKAQLVELESIKMEYANAQLECNAADERAKLLASEVIGLEEKALRLRSSELKLERQLENSQAEIATFNLSMLNFVERKCQALRKSVKICNRLLMLCKKVAIGILILRSRVFHLTSKYFQEKKLLQAKLRKASANGKFIDVNKGPSNKKDVSTSTDDLIHEDDADASADTSNQEMHSTAPFLRSEASSSSLLPENRQFNLEVSSLNIPVDQMKTIQNINTLISELALEKEELMRALLAESSESSTLKELNKDLSRKLEVQTQRLELLTAQSMAHEKIPTQLPDPSSMHDYTPYADEGDEVVERVLGWIMKLFPGGPSRRRTSKLL